MTMQTATDYIQGLPSQLAFALRRDADNWGSQCAGWLRTGNLRPHGPQYADHPFAALAAIGEAVWWIALIATTAQTGRMPWQTMEPLAVEISWADAFLRCEDLGLLGVRS